MAGVVAHNCKMSTQEVGPEVLGIQSQHCLQSKSEARLGYLRPCLNKPNPKQQTDIQRNSMQF